MQAEAATLRKVLDTERPQGSAPELWDGRAAGRIADVLEQDLGQQA